MNRYRPGIINQHPMTIDQMIAGLTELKQEFGGDAKVGIWVEGYWSGLELTVEDTIKSKEATPQS